MGAPLTPDGTRPQSTMPVSGASFPGRDLPPPPRASSDRRTMIRDLRRELDQCIDQTKVLVTANRAANQASQASYFAGKCQGFREIQQFLAIYAIGDDPAEDGDL